MPAGAEGRCARRCRRSARNLLHGVDQRLRSRPARHRRELSRAWRVERHRHDGDPTRARLWRACLRDRRQPREMRRLPRPRRRARDRLPAGGFCRRPQGSDTGQGRRCDPRHGRRSLCREEFALTRARRPPRADCLSAGQQGDPRPRAFDDAPPDDHRLDAPAAPGGGEGSDRSQFARQGLAADRSREGAPGHRPHLPARRGRCGAPADGIQRAYRQDPAPDELRERDMRILVLGAGAVGGYFGGRLAEGGRDVTFLVRAPRAAALAEHGLKVGSALGDFQVPVKVATADRIGGPYDLVILTAKHYDLDAAIEAIRPGVGPETAVLPLLNGLVHLDRLDAAFGLGRVLGGVAYVGAVLLPDGSVRHINRMSGIAFGERAGGISERARAIEQQFANTPVAAPANDNILQEMWEKFVMMGAMAGMNCLMRGNVGEIMATQDGEALMLQALAECRQVAEAAGYRPRPQARERVETMLTERGSINNASMRQDLEAGRRTEADAIVGDMLRRAAGFKIDTPLLRAAYCHLQVHENR